MTMWTIKRIDSQHGSEIAVDCAAGQDPVLVTLHDNDTGAEQTVAACFDPSAPGCELGTGFLFLLGVSFTPNDFDCS